jgi:hypothetical protein
VPDGVKTRRLLSIVALQNKRVLYGILFRAVSETLLEAPNQFFFVVN